MMTNFVLIFIGIVVPALMSVRVVKDKEYEWIFGILFWFMPVFPLLLYFLGE